MTVAKVLIGIIFNLAFFGVLLFLPAGTLDWRRAWIFLVVIFIGTVASSVKLYLANRELLEERFKPPLQKGQPLSDKIILTSLLASMTALILFIPLDVFRFHLLDRPPALISSLGLILFVAGWWLMTIVMIENAFAAPVVKHQEERHQTVIDTGVYGIVRHPMYASAILFLVGMCLWLESYAAAILAIIPVVILAVRILFEERFLKRELKGYDAYTRRVRYRIVPFIW